MGHVYGAQSAIARAPAIPRRILVGGPAVSLGCAGDLALHRFSAYAKVPVRVMSLESSSTNTRPLSLAVFGVLAEGAASSAGVYPLLMAELLARGHRVEFFGNPVYVRPRSLEGVPGYQFHPLHLEVLDRLWYRLADFDIPRALVSQLGNAAYHREAVRQIERVHQSRPYDAILCTDQQPLWPSKLPLIAWPQGPPHTEAAALRARSLAPALLKTWGIGRYAAIQVFYAYRIATARLALGGPDIYLCGSRWAGEAWRRFGVPHERVRPVPYPIEFASLSAVSPLEQKPTVTFLWLGRAVPRKRFDLFVEGFSRLRQKHPRVRARIVGDVAAEPFNRAALARYAGTPDLSVEQAVPRADVARLFGEVDVLVQPSQNENFGFSVAEALVAGRGVVAGPTNGTLEYAGKAGFAFEKYTAESVALAMERAMDAVVTEGPELSRRAREAARTFALETVTDRFCAICEELLVRKRTPGTSPASSAE